MTSRKKLAKVAKKLGINLQVPPSEPTNLERLERSCVNAARRVEDRVIRNMDQSIRTQLDEESAVPGYSNRDLMIRTAIGLAQAGNLEALKIFLDYELPKNAVPSTPPSERPIYQFINTAPSARLVKQLEASGDEVEFLTGEVVGEEA